MRRINHILLLLIILINGYVLIAPLLPRVSYVVKQNVTKPVKVNAQKPETIAQIDRSRNHLILPNLQLDEPIFDGASPDTVHKGIWRRPNTSTPEQGSNTVLVGHRFTYHGEAVFYNLDKLRVGQDAYLIYKTRIYHYRIHETKVVPASDITVEAPTNLSILTLYTCTPIWSAKDRLVYIANLVEVN